MKIKDRQNSPLLEVEDLVIHYETDEGVVEAVNGVSFKLEKGECLGIVGETGAGKTTIAKMIMQQLPYPPSHVIRGTVKINGDDLGKKSRKQMEKIRGKKLSMIFQDPMTALNPVIPIGQQISEVIKIHEKLSKIECERKAIDMLEIVGIRAERYKDFPHQLSGGMKQRVIIAIALACNPRLLIADEPTTALDVTIQAQILDLIKNLQNERQMGVMLITHDLGIVAEICTKCIIVYAGEIVESGTVEQIFNNPCHPYTIGLFNSIPSLDKDVDRLCPIPGDIIDPTSLPNHCSFYERCEFRKDSCKNHEPQLIEIEPNHFVKCSSKIRK
ncbi:MAG: ABC transporter ATP-binding protein [Pleomorphochaeta sp.]